jgi:hypothetical protein
MKTLHSILALTSAAVLSLTLSFEWCKQRQRSWDARMQTLRMHLLESDENGCCTQLQSWEELPRIVQRFLDGIATLSTSPSREDDSTVDSSNMSCSSSSITSKIRSLTIQQEGFFSLQNAWLPFTAYQFVSALARKPGFVWEARIAPKALPRGFQWPRVRVCDAWSNGRGHLEASLAGIITVASMTEPDEVLLQGEMLRWLAEAPLIPTVLHPSTGIVFWHTVPNEPLQAMLSMKDPYTSLQVSLTATFDEKLGRMTTIQGLRPKACANGSGSFELSPWIGHFYNYTWQESVHFFVPTHMECGWIVDGIEELYFKGDNVELNYNVETLRLEQINSRQSQ